jgi:hypothetical protein
MLSIDAELTEAGEAGSNVTSLPEASTAVHWLTEGQATPLSPLLATAACDQVRGWRGLKVTSDTPATAVHWVTDGHTTVVNDPPPSDWTTD